MARVICAVCVHMAKRIDQRRKHPGSTTCLTCRSRKPSLAVRFLWSSAFMFNYHIPALTSNKLLRTCSRTGQSVARSAIRAACRFSRPMRPTTCSAVLPRNTSKRPLTRTAYPACRHSSKDPNCHCFDPSRHVHSESGRVDATGGRPVRYRRAVLQRLSLAAAAIREA